MIELILELFQNVKISISLNSQEYLEGKILREMNDFPLKLIMTSHSEIRDTTLYFTYLNRPTPHNFDLKFTSSSLEYVIPDDGGFENINTLRFAIYAGEGFEAELEVHFDNLRPSKNHPELLRYNSINLNDWSRFYNLNVDIPKRILQVSSISRMANLGKVCSNIENASKIKGDYKLRASILKKRDYVIKQKKVINKRNKLYLEKQQLTIDKINTFQLQKKKVMRYI